MWLHGKHQQTQPDTLHFIPNPEKPGTEDTDT